MEEYLITECNDIDRAMGQQFSKLRITTLDELAGLVNRFGEGPMEVHLPAYRKLIMYERILTRWQDCKLITMVPDNLIIDLIAARMGL